MTREKAINLVKQVLPCLNVDEKIREGFKTLIPELRESEDERIRKVIYKLMLGMREEIFTSQDEIVTKEKVLAYLEKQKEQKPAHTAKEMWKEMRLEVYAQASGNRHEPNCSDDSTKMFSLCDIDEIFEKIGNSTIELQPSEWSEEKVAELAIDCAERSPNFPIGHTGEDKRRWVKTYVEGFETAIKKSLCPVKQEWSEEDEKRVKQLIYDTEHIRAEYEKRKKELGESFNDELIKDCDEQIAWLKLLSSKLKKRNEDVAKLCSNEWSEENEKTIWGLTAYIPNEELERLGITRFDILKKLKSLCPPPIQLKEAYKDGFQTSRHAMALAFMNNLDENRSKGKMGLSNGECEDIDKAFKEGDWAKIMRYVEKYSPQPKQEWSEEEYGRLFDIEHYLDGTLQLNPDRKIACIDFLKSLRPQPNQEWNEEEKEKIRQNGRLDVCYNPEKYGLCHKIEWSEEDERVWQELIYFFTHDTTEWFPKRRVSVASVVKFLKSLRPHWKPSEEEELNICPHYSDGYGCDISPMKKCESCEHRPHWKPSEEQMIALDGCLEHWSGNKSQKEILESLYEDLVKLKGGCCSYEGYRWVN